MEEETHGSSKKYEEIELHWEIYSEPVDERLVGKREM